MSVLATTALSSAPRSAVRRETSALGMCLGLTGIAMLFIALTSAYVVRQGLDPGWNAIRMPAILPFNTLVLLASGFTMEKARRAIRPGRWLPATLALGLCFLALQLAAWRELSAGGVYLSTNAHSSFFYLLTGLHGLHLTGGIFALTYLAVSRNERWLQATALYWHFMDALWVYLLVLLFGWR